MEERPRTRGIDRAIEVAGQVPLPLEIDTANYQCWQQVIDPKIESSQEVEFLGEGVSDHGRSKAAKIAMERVREESDDGVVARGVTCGGLPLGRLAAGEVVTELFEARDAPVGGMHWQIGKASISSRKVVGPQLALALDEPVSG